VTVPTEVTLRVWGSECLACGNATCGSDCCDSCGSSEHTTPLYIDADAKYLDD
jgi:rRNA maturation endonuclease Nob1